MRLWWKSREQSADLLAYEGDFITFQVDKPLSPGLVVEVEAHLPEHVQFGAGLIPVHEVELEPALKEFIRSLGYAPRQHVYCGKLDHPEEARQHLHVLLEQHLPTQGSHHHRLHPRVHRHLSVMARDLPGFRAATLDLSFTGLCLKTEEPLQEGQSLELEIRFDETQFPPLSVEVRVLWCQRLRPESGRAEYHVGAEFVGLDREQRRELEDFVKLAQEPFRIYTV